VKDPITWLYPLQEPFNTGRVRVSPVHEIYFEESGKPSGKPVVFLHGGPGGGSEPKQRRFFNPAKYRIVNFDQRGCGKSTPYASLEENTTWHLVADIEKIREHLGIDRWQVFGGSWGSTLALAYSQRHPERVSELILRGIFLLRKQEIDWFYQYGASALYPDAWEPYVSFIPEAERSDMLSAYYRRLTNDDPAVRLAAAKIWNGVQLQSFCPMRLSLPTTKRTSSPSPSLALKPTISSTRVFSKQMTSCCETFREFVTFPR